MNAQRSQAETHPNDPRRSLPGVGRRLNYRKVIIFLSACMALQMTSFVIILPLFARRFSQLGAGAEALATSTMAYALAGTLAAPLMGDLADRLGRRLVVLASLAAYVLAFTGFLFASSVSAFVVLRGLAGVFTAGLMPAVTGIVADLAPTDQRGKWIGIVNGGAAVGYVAGPVVGGWLYDGWGYDTALVVSISVASLTFLTACLMVPGIRRDSNRPAGEKPGTPSIRPASLSAMFGGLRSTLPTPLFVFVALLGVVFAAMFAYAFIEPSFMFYAYDNLGWTSSMLGLAISTYGTAFMVGEFGLGHLSDQLGRKPVILAGLVLFTAQFVGLAFGRNSAAIAASFAIAGLGNALFDPAVSAAILDITPADHQACVLGIKSTASSPGSVLGPALVVLVAPLLTPQAIFLGATSIVGLGVLFFLSARMQPRPSGRDHAIPQPDLTG